MKASLTEAAIAAACAFGLLIVAQPGGAATAKTASSTDTVSLTGCLRADGAKYKLTDLKGAPKGRSWKTGWIMKSTKDVEVIAAASGPKLKDHVNHEVTVTGQKAPDQPMQARSIKHVAPSCS